MESINNVVNLTQLNVCIESIDLKDSIFPVPVHVDDRKFTKFIFDNLFHNFISHNLGHNSVVVCR